MVKTTNRLLEKTNLRRLLVKDERYNYQSKTLLFWLFFICTLNSFSQVELKGKVIDAVEKGYKLGDKIIRYPKVVIGQS